MIATMIKRADGLCLTLVFDDGRTAYYYGAMNWRLFEADGTPFGEYNVRHDQAACEMRRAIEAYSLNHMNTLGRIA